MVTGEGGVNQSVEIETVPLKLDQLMSDIDTAFVQQVFDIS